MIKNYYLSPPNRKRWYFHNNKKDRHREATIFLDEKNVLSEEMYDFQIQCITNFIMFLFMQFSYTYNK